MEPSPQTLEEVGRLCTAWTFLELVTEQAIWGILDIDEKIGPYLTYRLDMRGRWALLMECAPRKHGAGELEELSSINDDVGAVGRDRNIIVHGFVHSQAKTNLATNPPAYTILEDHQITGFERVPCWTVNRGVDRGKNFPVSKEAVETVRLNIQKLFGRVQNFNTRFGYTKVVTRMPDVEKDWPKAL